MTKPKLPTAKQARLSAYRMHSLIVRAAGDGCQGYRVVPGECNGVLQCAHLVSKEQAGWVSTLQRNGIVLCAKHHQVIDNNRHRWLQLLEFYGLAPLVLELQGIQDRSMGLPTRGAKWWRSEAERLHGVCVSSGIEPVGVIRLMIRWIEEQRETTCNA